MGLFDLFKKKKEEKVEESCCCCCGEEKAEESCCCCGEEKAEESCCCCCGEEKAEESCCCCGEEKAEESCCCCCGEEKAEKSYCCGEPVDGICCIKVLGACCNTCHKQLEYVKEAVKILGLDIVPEQVEDMSEIMDYGVLNLPAVVVNDKVICKGKAVRADDIVKLIKKHGF